MDQSPSCVHIKLVDTPVSIDAIMSISTSVDYRKTMIEKGVAVFRDYFGSPILENEDSK